jgi:23S rRNA (uridine2552-2'-O)-methyltransferase
MAKSNKAWLRRHVTDQYVRKARQQGYRSRAAFKLLELDEKEKLLRAGMRVLDLGAAPGGWSQVAAGKGAKVTAVDLLPIAPIPGVTVLQGDFRSVLQDLPRFDVVLSDLSPNLSGIRNVDQARAFELLQAALAICRMSLQPDGAFVFKIFHGEAFDEAHAAIEQVFSRVRTFKPAASRGESRETYLVARGLRDRARASEK